MTHSAETMETTATPTEKIPVLIVAGFLGAGKTTLIRELIPRVAAGPRAPYVILNDFLNAAIDAFSLKGLGAEIKGIAAGCVCCDDSTSLIDAILRVPVSIKPLLIIEANGTTDPYRLIELLTLTADVRELLGPILQVTIINESRWGKRLLPGDKHTERAQVRTASAILTNRGETASDKQKQRLRDSLLELNPRAPRLDFDAFVDLLLQEAASEALPAPDTSQPIEHVHHHVAVRLEPPVMSEERLRQWLLSLPRDILRVKGLARISDTHMAYFNRTDDPFEQPRIIRSKVQDGMEPAVVFIGPGLNEESLLASFHAEKTASPFKLHP
jgi:G3E family GTPase